MELYLLIPGLIILALTLYDVIYTTIAPNGSALISGGISNGIWYLFYLMKRLTGRRSFLNGAGVVIVVSILISWVALLWIGNFLVFSSDQNSIVDTATNEAANKKQVFYYTGYLLSTMGNGDFRGGTENWQVYSSFISFFGLIMITIAITYVVPVIAAITDRRTLSIRIASIGHSSQAMLLKHWNGENFKLLEYQFEGLAQQIVRQGQLHFAYPVLFFFHHETRIASLLPNLAALDEALTLILLYIPEDKRPAKEHIIPLRVALTTFIQSLSSTFIQPSDSPPPLDTEDIRKAGITLLEPDQELVNHINYRRCILKQMVNHDGWEWKDLRDNLLDSKLDIISKINL